MAESPADTYNARIIEEFRANEGRVGGPWAGGPRRTIRGRTGSRSSRLAERSSGLNWIASAPVGAPVRRRRRVPEGGQATMKTPPIVSSQEWDAAREELLVEEKKLTRARDALAAKRRRMPWMAVEKEYRFEG